MGWRSDKAYKETRDADFRRWRGSLTWREYAGWQWDRHRYFLAGAASAAVVLGVVLYLSQ